MSSLSQTQFSEQEAQRPVLSDPEISEIPAVRIQDGLVPAAQLPSAADFLAQLFPPEARQTDDFSNDVSAAPTGEASESQVAEVTEVQASISHSRQEAIESRLNVEVSVKTDLQEQADTAEPLLGGDVLGGASPDSESALEIAEDSSREKVDEPARDSKLPTKSSFASIAASARNLLHGFLNLAGRAKSRNAQDSSEENSAATEQTPAATEERALADTSAETMLSSDASHTNAGALPLPEIRSEEHDFSRAAMMDEPPAPIQPVEGLNSHPYSQASPPTAEEAAVLRSLYSIENLPANEPAPTGDQAEPFRAAAIQANAASPEEKPFLGSETHAEAKIRDENASEPETIPAPPAEWRLDSPQADFTGQEELEEVDTADDDAAIASAIERYANLTDDERAKAFESLEASVPASGPESRPNDQVDINAVFGINDISDISRDVGPGDSVLGYVVPSLQSLDIEESPAPSVPSAPPSAERSTAENSRETASSIESPEKPSAPAPPAIPYRVWSFEEKLASHHEWIESKGKIGKKADFSDADMEGTELIGVDLRFIDLHDATLRATDLLMADLRDACLVRANLRDSCLVGANLEGANLEGANLETAMGLVPRQLAGANLHEAVLPPHILAFEAHSEFKRASRTVYGFFVGIMSLSALSWLIIWMTKDFQLLTNSAVLPFLHSPAAAAALPAQQFYLIAPFGLFIAYLVFHFHLQHLWDMTLELPAVFPDGRTLGENEPRIVLGLLRTHFRWMNQEAPSTRIIEKVISVFVAYWIVPATLLLYWLRFLTLQNVHGTVLQELLVVGAAGAALYSTTKVGRQAEAWTQRENAAERLIGKYKNLNPFTAALVVLGVLTFLSAGTITGVPHGKERAPQFMAASIRRWAPSVLWSFGIDPYADLTESVISTKPANWNGSDEQVSSVKGARLNDSNFRYAQAYRVFLVNAHLLRAKFQGAFLSQADFRGADLGQSNLRYAVLDQAQLNHTNLDRAVLDGANLSRADVRAANLSYASLAGATLVDARLDGATLYGAKLPSAILIRTNFEKADLRESHLEGANLEHADMQGAYLWSSKLAGAHLNNAQLGTAIFVDADLRGADLRWAQLTGTVLTGADLTGTLLDGADFRSAVGFGANQICSAKSRRGLLLADAMQAQVTAQCGPRTENHSQ